LIRAKLWQGIIAYNGNRFEDARGSFQSALDLTRSGGSA